MDTQTTIALIAMLLIAALCFWISIRSFREKGFLINNAWIYASEAQREKMDKRPYYRQSAIVFLGLGVMFLLTALTIWIGMSVIPVVIIAVGLIIYAIVSTVSIRKTLR